MSHELGQEQTTLGASSTGEWTAPQETASSAGAPSEELRALTEELAALRREQAKLHQAIFEAAQIQRRLCAPREFTSGELEIAGEIFPVRHLSGDFFKVMELDSALGIVVGDIAGKGLSAGIWMTHLMGLVHGRARVNSDPAAVLAEVNRELCGGYGEPPLTALFFARMDPQRGTITYSNAGLPAPLILGRGRTVVHLDKGGPMLGALREAAFSTGTVTLGPGDTLLAYTDGVTECQNSQDEEFDVKGLTEAAMAANGASASRVLFSTLGTVLDFAEGRSPGDDLTLLVVRRRAEAVAQQARSRARDFSRFAPGQDPAIRSGGSSREGLVS